ncbi:MAG: glycosyltransferase family 4 protein [Catalinimonas sp.]
MKIGILAPIAWRTPPEHYGGWELVASGVSEGLVARGHDVRLFATADSLTAAHLEAVCPHPLTRPDHGLDSRVMETLHVAHAYERAQALGLDILHNHAGAFGVPPAALVDFPVVTTLHGSAAEAGSRRIYGRYPTHPYVSISDAERRLAPNLHYVATVYNGIAVERFPFAERPGDYLLCIGRMSPDKGIHVAIAAARRAGVPLVLAGIVPVENQAYFEREVAPHLGAGVEFVGPVGHQEKGRLLAGARAFLHLVTYEEAFGLTMAESMACGTPVIATRRGSVPELIEEGRTGFIVPAEGDPTAAAVASINKTHMLDRTACRQHATRFDVSRMVEGYERVYRQLLAR